MVNLLHFYVCFQICQRWSMLLVNSCFFKFQTGLAWNLLIHMLLVLICLRMHPRTGGQPGHLRTCRIPNTSSSRECWRWRTSSTSSSPAGHGTNLISSPQLSASATLISSCSFSCRIARFLGEACFSLTTGIVSDGLVRSSRWCCCRGRDAQVQEGDPRAPRRRRWASHKVLFSPALLCSGCNQLWPSYIIWDTRRNWIWSRLFEIYDLFFNHARALHIIRTFCPVLVLEITYNTISNFVISWISLLVLSLDDECS
jgi:hypothetical protein